MHTAQIAIHADKINEPLPDAVQRVPSMMSARERSLLLALAEHEYRGDGVIVDAGVFCGASTMCFGTAIKVNPAYRDIVARWKKPIHTYEFGIVNPGMIPFFERHGVTGDWQVGDSFEKYLRGNIKPVSRLVKLHMGDIALADWSGDPIEILFLDVLKSNEIQRVVMREFMPCLLEGGILIQQDYFIDGLPFLKIMQEHLADHFEYLGEVQSSAVFRLIRKIDRAQLASDPLDTIAPERKLELLDRARDRSIDPDRRLLCDLGKVRFLSSIDQMQAAQALLDSLPGTYPAQFGDKQMARIKMALRAATNAVRDAPVPLAIDV